MIGHLRGIATISGLQIFAQSILPVLTRELGPDGFEQVRKGTRKLTELAAGQVFGEMALLDNQTRSATVTALEPMRMLVIPGPAFRKLLAKVPGLTDALLATLSARLREADAAADL